MMKILYCGSSSACFELENAEIYYAPGPYSVFVDGREAFSGNTNVFSLFGLKPDTEYGVQVRFASGPAETIRLRTGAETCCVNVRDFGAAGDGVHDDTGAIQAAVNFLPALPRGDLPEPAAFAALPHHARVLRGSGPPRLHGTYALPDHTRNGPRSGSRRRNADGGV